MHKRFILYTILVSHLASLYCNSNHPQSTLIPKQTKAIVINDSTAVRVDPYIFSSRITTVNKGTVVQVLDTSKEMQWVGNESNYWYKVQLPNNIKGWIFGSSLSLQINASDAAIERYVNNLWKKEADIVRKEIAGKWWSTNKYGDFTEHCLELLPDGSYKSYKKGSNEITGSFSLNFRTQEIIFLDGTSFGHNLRFEKRGTTYKLLTPDYSIEFKKISEFKTSTDSTSEITIPNNE